jgi:4-phytase/acid phosphatase
MAPRVGGLIARRIATTLTAPRAPAVSVLVGHDNTIAAVTALLGTGFQLPGYGRNDPPIGGGLLFERLIDRRTGRASLRLSYLAQTPDQARSLAPLPQSGPAAPRHPLALGRCGSTCTPQGFAALIAQETRCWTNRADAAWRTPRHAPRAGPIHRKQRLPAGTAPTLPG